MDHAVRDPIRPRKPLSAPQTRKQLLKTKTADMFAHFLFSKPGVRRGPMGVARALAPLAWCAHKGGLMRLGAAFLAITDLHNSLHAVRAAAPRAPVAWFRK